MGSSVESLKLMNCGRETLRTQKNYGRRQGAKGLWRQVTFMGTLLAAVAEGDDWLVACAICFDWPLALQIYSAFRKTRQVRLVSLF